MTTQTDIQAVLNGFLKTKVCKKTEKQLEAIENYKGRTIHVAETKKYLSELQSSRARKVKTPHGVFASAKDAGKHYNTTPQRIRRWVEEKKGFVILSAGSSVPITKNPKLLDKNDDLALTKGQIREKFVKNNMPCTSKEMSMLLYRKFNYKSEVFAKEMAFKIARKLNIKYIK